MKATGKTLISISIPVLNEAENLPVLYGRLSDLSEQLSDVCDLEFIFSDNCSSDDTWQLLGELARCDNRVKAIRFSKNVGFQRSILANLMHTSGDAVMQIDADLQDPPEMLTRFMEQWQEGYKVIYGIRRGRPESRAIYFFRKLGYWLIDLLSEHPIPRDVGDFRLMDRQVVDALLAHHDAAPYLRGMIANLGFRQTGIVYDREARAYGASKFNVRRLVGLGLAAVLNHSVVPLRAASFLGLLILGFSFLGAVYYLILKMFYPQLPEGLASIHILVLFGIGLHSFLLGIIGEYLLRIYIVIRRDPVAIVENAHNFETSQIKL